MARRAKQEQYIKAETIRIGDTIRVTWNELDITHSIVGIVASRDHGLGSTFWYTKQGAILLTRLRDMKPRSPNSMHDAKITLLEPGDDDANSAVPLFEM